MNTSTAVSVATIGVDQFDFLCQYSSRDDSVGFRPFLRGVIPAFTDFKRLTHDPEIELVFVIVDELEFQRVSLAKKATAFFKMSRS